MQRLRAANRGKLKRLLRGDHFRIAREHFVQLRDRVHLLPHVQVVVRRGSIRAQTDEKVFGQHLRHWRNTGRKLHI